MSNLRRLRLGDEKKKIEGRRNHREKNIMFASATQGGHNQIGQLAFSLPIKSNLAFFKGVWQWKGMESIWQSCSQRHRNFLRRVTSKSCNGKTVSRREKKLPQKGHTVRPSAVKWNAYGEPNTHAVTCSCVTGDRLLTWRSVIEIWVTLRASTAETVSRTKSRFRVGTPLALPSSNR